MVILQKIISGFYKEHVDTVMRTKNAHHKKSSADAQRRAAISACSSPAVDQNTF